MEFPPFNELIRAGRVRLGLTQVRLAGELKTPQKPQGVWVTYISQIERGEKIPSDDVCLKLANVLVIDPSQVLLAAHEERTQVVEARTLIRSARWLFQSGLADLEDRDALRRLLTAVGTDSPLHSALKDKDLCAVLGGCYRSDKSGELLKVLERMASLDDAQWSLFANFLEALLHDDLDGQTEPITELTEAAPQS